jgi:hypothetical protein
LRIASGIHGRCGYRSHYRRKENIRIDIENAVGNAGRLVERSQPAVYENNKLRWTRRAHGIRRERTGFRRTRHTIPLQSDCLGSGRTGDASGGGCRSITRHARRDLGFRTRSGILRPVSAAWNLQFALYENIFSGSSGGLLRHDVSSRAVNRWLSFLRPANRHRTCAARGLAKTAGAEKY